MGTRAEILPCKVIDSIVSGGAEKLATLFPLCAEYARGASPEQSTVVVGSMTSSWVEAAVSMRLGFTVGGWLAILIHVVAVELYVSPLSLPLPVTQTAVMLPHSDC